LFTQKINFMRRLLLPLLAMILFTSCQKQISTDISSNEIPGAAVNKQTKFTVCHYDVLTGTSKTIEVTQSALAGHLAHGDVQGSCSDVVTTICGKDWMKKNLDVSTYRNGDPIPQVTDPSEWLGLTTGAWCYYENNSANGTVYGKLYNWYAVNDPRGLAPAGWHVATDAEWTAMTTCLGGETVAGGALKEAGDTHWWNNTDATNSSGFTALPAGYRADLFYNITYETYFWTSTEVDGSTALARYLQFTNGGIHTDLPGDGKYAGVSVRCTRNY
jgi:uncharacterized protein (TIGR02145 family)